MKEGKIIGMDNRTCICCGGTEIIIDDVANPNGCSYFLAAQFPDGFTINEKETFPITIKMDWAVDSLHCFGNYIAITKIERK